MAERMMLGMTSLLAGIPLIVIGILFYHGKAGFLLAGYNTMSREEKAKWDEKRLLRFSGKCIIALGIIPMGMELVILSGLPAGPVYGIGWTAYALLIVWMIVYMNTKGHFRKK